jgi:hypothetical protein
LPVNVVAELAEVAEPAEVAVAAFPEHAAEVPPLAGAEPAVEAYVTDWDDIFADVIGVLPPIVVVDFRVAI